MEGLMIQLKDNKPANIKIKEPPFVDGRKINSIYSKESVELLERESNIQINNPSEGKNNFMSIKP